MEFKEKIKNYIGFIILGGAMLFAVIRVGHNQLTYEAPDVTTISICHWQLEAGFRGALQELIDEYEEVYEEKTGKKLKIRHIPVSERGYKQFINTGLVGGNAPDIIERGKAKTANDPAYVSRFFRPISMYIERANPYNKGTSLEGVPWRETYFDTMEGGYDGNLLDYYIVPFSMFTTRIFYNKDMYKEVSGSDEPPKDFEEFMRVCNQVREYARQKEENIVPISGSKYQGNVFSGRLEPPFCQNWIRAADYDYNGGADVCEVYRAYREKKWSFDAPRKLAAWDCMVEVARNFQEGWMAANRDDALFTFIQEKSMMIASGSWDSPSIRKSAEGRFEVGVMDFPIPVDHPKYGKYVKGPMNEADTRSSVPWAITKQSKHPEICIDFLMYCTTRKNNERFNKRITWMPVIRGARVADELKAFLPKVKGFGGSAWSFNTNISTEFSLRRGGGLWELYSGRQAPEEFAAQLAEIYERTGEDGFAQELDKRRRRVRNLERPMSAFLYNAFAMDTDEAEHKLVTGKAQNLLNSHQFNIHTNSINRNFLETLKQKEGDNL